MTSDPIALALRHINETRQMLDALITSSESFDYPKAKIALKLLEKKSRELAKLSGQFAEALPAASNVISFPVSRAPMEPGL